MYVQYVAPRQPLSGDYDVFSACHAVVNRLQSPEASLMHINANPTVADNCKAG